MVHRRRRSSITKLFNKFYRISTWKKNDANKDDLAEEKISGVSLKWAEFASSSSTHRKIKYGN
nr:8877_t:CDS:2 [Entrophospora candida]